jgi:hypothetical protein
VTERGGEDGGGDEKGRENFSPKRRPPEILLQAEQLFLGREKRLQLDQPVLDQRAH